MGFGCLLIGYVFAFVATIGLGPYLFAGMLVGGFLMYLGLSELRKYAPVFLYAMIGSILIILCSLYYCVTWIDTEFMLGMGTDAPTIANAFRWIKFVLYLIFDFSMLYGIINLSKRVDYPEIGEKAVRNMIFVTVFNVFQIIMVMPFVLSLKDEDLAALLTLLLIVQVVYTVINAFLLFKCYAMICPEGQEDMPRKKSKFEFVNKFREISDAKEDKAIEDMKNYYEDKLKRKNEKKQIQHSSKKRKKK